jgi:tRNA-binding protein
MKKISYRDFSNVEIRVGKIIKAQDFPKAVKPAYKLWIDFGHLGVKKASAQITKLYDRKDMLNKKVIAVVNFPPKQVADFISEVLVLGVVLEDGAVSLLSTDHDVPLGARVL